MKVSQLYSADNLSLVPAKISVSQLTTGVLLSTSLLELFERLKRALFCNLPSLIFVGTMASLPKMPLIMQSCTSVITQITVVLAF